MLGFSSPLRELDELVAHPAERVTLYRVGGGGGVGGGGVAELCS